MAETTYLMEAADGMLVRVPESKLEAWAEAQEKQKPEATLSRSEQQLRDKIVQKIFRK